MRDSEFEAYKIMVKSAPLASRLKMMEELKKVILNIENTNRVIRRRLALGAPRASSYGRKIQKVRARIARKKLQRLQSPRTKTNVSNIFRGLSI
jgi:hypothetical protein